MAGTPVVWEIDVDNPSGVARPMSASEQTQYTASQTAYAADAARQALLDANAATIQQTVAGRLTQVRAARAAIANGTLFAGLSVNERAVIDGLLVDDIYLARLALELFDATT